MLEELWGMRGQRVGGTAEAAGNAAGTQMKRILLCSARLG